MRFPATLTFSLSWYLIRKRLSGAKRFSFVLMLEPLHACNLSCKGCGRIREYEQTIDQHMSVGQCLESAGECGAPIVSVCGGEPLIYPEIGPLVRDLEKMGRHVYLCTNGLLLKQKLALFEPSGQLILNIHLDGERQTHDAIVGREGVFDAALEGIAAAKAKGFLVSTNTTIYRETEISDVEQLFDRLSKLGVDTHMLSPGYGYEGAGDGNIFMTRAEIMTKFGEVDRLSRRYTLSDTPAYLQFLKGERELPCAAWGNPTRNPVGWRSPCYLLADRHYDTFRGLMEETNWDAYGPGRDPRCENCMVHCGFEPSAVMGASRRVGDLLRMLAWQLS